MKFLRLYVFDWLTWRLCHSHACLLSFPIFYHSQRMTINWFFNSRSLSSLLSVLMALRAPTKVISNKKWIIQTSSPSSILCWPQDDDQPHLRPTLAWLSVRFLRAFNFRVTWKQKPSAIGLLDKEIKGCLDIIIGCWSSKNLKKWVAAAAASICLMCSWQPLWIPAWKITLMRLSLPGGSFAQQGQYSEHQLEGSWTSGGERTADSVETAERRRWGNRELGIGWRWN